MDDIIPNEYMRGILPNHTNLNFYVDASHASDVDTRRSKTGYIFFISGGPVSWQSRMQTSVALSSMEADHMADLQLECYNLTFTEQLCLFVCSLTFQEVILKLKELKVRFSHLNSI